MIASLPFILFLWVGGEQLSPGKSDIRAFDPVLMGRQEANMWRYYYEGKRVKLFTQLAKTLRIQFQAPFFKSYTLAMRATRAALTFQKGKAREDYSKALPHLQKYYKGIKKLSAEEFEVESVSQRELEWWIIRREREQHPPSDWVEEIASIAAEIYHIPKEKAWDHAEKRVEAMLFRDRRGEEITQGDWEEIEKMLIASWTSLLQEITRPNRGVSP